MTLSHEIRESIIVSGASTGLGAATAHELARRGFHVLAGVRAERDAEQFAGDHIEAVTLDVTQPAHIAALAAKLEHSGTRLRAVVNNAGLALNAPVETLPLDDWRRVLDVNVLGLVALTQAVLPALHASGGRVVNISSVGGRVSMPAFGAYSASKFAVEAISDALRQELRLQGVRVVVVQPGGMRTEMGPRGRAAAEAQLAAMTPVQRRRYQPAMDAFLRYTAALTGSGTTPEVAARTVVRAVTDANPRTRYAVGAQAAVLLRLVRVLPDRAIDAMVARTLRA
jgi:NAD(P)-dependent dehydrogenase (short-subunit alcohol dehydrogenase family)